MTREPESFSSEVSQKLRTYVYRLIDPRNGETFYVGKGKGNRVFAHIRGEEVLEGDEIDNKLKRIREIRVAGFEVAHVIHRHGMDDATAFEVEAALIDAYPGLTNIVGGPGGADYGTAHAKEIIRRYSAEPAVFQHRAILISVNRSAAERSLYDATRYAWKISKSKAKQAEVVLATMQGLIVGAFVAHDWLEATPANFPGRDGVPGRLGFVGEDAPGAIKSLYVGKRVPDEYRKRGAANPIKYTWGTKAAEQGDAADAAAPRR
ncbi:MAG: LEM-3-like GIY-YIG domain-containing protein [Longimicrobiales bacterium]